MPNFTETTLTESLDRPDFDSSHGFFDRPHI